MTGTVLLTGLFAGLVHALAGPDHLAAVAPLTVSSRRAPWRIGLLWGLGHATGVAVVAAVALALRHAVALDRLGAWGEIAVGLALVGIGLWGLRRAFSRWVHAHPHRHGSVTHTHVHVHRPGRPHGPHEHPHAATAVGLLHGVAGTSHLVGVLPALALPGAGATALYIAGYGGGNLLGMVGFAWLVGRLAEWLAPAGVRAYRILLGGSAAAAIAVGLVWLRPALG